MFPGTVPPLPHWATCCSVSPLLVILDAIHWTPKLLVTLLKVGLACTQIALLFLQVNDPF